MGFVVIYRENNISTVRACNKSFSWAQKPKIRTKNPEVFLFHVMYGFDYESQKPCRKSLILLNFRWNTLPLCLSLGNLHTSPI